MLSLRPANDNDIELVMAWRSDPDIYQGYYTQTQPLVWNEHITWWKSRNQDWRLFIAEYEGRRIGWVCIGQLDHWSPEIGYTVGEKSLWGKGFGREMVLEALRWLKSQGKEYCHTTVLEDNERSLKLLQNLGFEIAGRARKGELWLSKVLG